MPKPKKSGHRSESEDTSSDSSSSSESSSTEEEVKIKSKAKKSKSKRKRKAATSSSSSSTSDGSDGESDNSKRDYKKKSAKDERKLKKVYSRSPDRNYQDDRSRNDKGGTSSNNRSKWDSPTGENHEMDRQRRHDGPWRQRDFYNRNDQRRWNNNDFRDQRRYQDNREQRGHYDREGDYRNQRRNNDGYAERRRFDPKGPQYGDRESSRERFERMCDRKSRERERDYSARTLEAKIVRMKNNDRSSRRHPRRDEEDIKNYQWGRSSASKDLPPSPVEKEKPNFGLSGKLAEDTNKVNGVVIKYSEPLEARKPKRRWRLYPFKGEKALTTLYIHRQSCFLIGRDRKVCDLPIDHPSCSKQHAALQYRLVPFQREDGTEGKRVRPYIIDLESANGTFLNNKQIDSKKYIELIEKDVIKFGFSSREYVLLHENSKEDQMDDDVKLEPGELEVEVKPEPE